MSKVKTTVEIDEALDERFRMTVIERKGFHKGVLGEAIEEAIETWLDPEFHEIIERRRTANATKRRAIR